MGAARRDQRLSSAFRPLRGLGPGRSPGPDRRQCPTSQPNSPRRRFSCPTAPPLSHRLVDARSTRRTPSPSRLRGACPEPVGSEADRRSTVRVKHGLNLSPTLSPSDRVRCHPRPPSSLAKSYEVEEIEDPPIPLPGVTVRGVSPEFIFGGGPCSRSLRELREDAGVRFALPSPRTLGTFGRPRCGGIRPASPVPPPRYTGRAPVPPRIGLTRTKERPWPKS